MREPLPTGIRLKGNDEYLSTFSGSDNGKVLFFIFLSSTNSVFFGKGMRLQYKCCRRRPFLARFANGDYINLTRHATLAHFSADSSTQNMKKGTCRCARLKEILFKCVCVQIGGKHME